MDGRNMNVRDMVFAGPQDSFAHTLNPRASSFQPTEAFGEQTADNQDDGSQVLSEDIQISDDMLGAADLALEPLMHASFAGFFGDTEVVHVHGILSKLDVIDQQIAVNGKAMSRGDDPGQMVVDIYLEYGVVSCDCAIGLPASTEGGRTDAEQVDATVAPDEAPTPAKTPDILLGRKFNVVTAEDETLPALDLGPTLLHPLAGRPKPKEIPDPLEKPKGVSYAKWDNASEFKGLSDDEILGGWVHPENLQGTLALKLAHNHKNSEFGKAVTALYKQAGLEAPTKSALTYRWTHALKAQCECNRAKFEEEKKRIRNLRQSGAPADTAAVAPVIPFIRGRATPAALFAFSRRKKAKYSQEESSTQALGTVAAENAGNSGGAKTIEPKSAAPSTADGTLDSRKRKRSDMIDHSEVGSSKPFGSVSKVVKGFAASELSCNDSGVTLLHGSLLFPDSEKTNASAETIGFEEEEEIPNAKRRKADQKKAAGWRI